MANARKKSSRVRFDRETARQLTEIGPYCVVAGPGSCEVYWDQPVEALASPLTTFFMVWTVSREGASDAPAPTRWCSRCGSSTCGGAALTSETSAVTCSPRSGGATRPGPRASARLLGRPGADRVPIRRRGPAAALDAILDALARRYRRRGLDHERRQLGAGFPRLEALLAGREGVRSLIRFDAVCVSPAEGRKRPRVGFYGKDALDPDHGFGVVTLSGRVLAVGGADAGWRVQD
jgi:hypothetical protein